MRAHPRGQIGGRGGADRETSQARQVNNLLSTLRDEQYRHAQNVLGRYRAVRSPVPPSYKPTLPLSAIYGTEPASEGNEEGNLIQPAPFRAPGQPGHRPPVTLIEGVPTYAFPNGAVPGPKPPKSWSPLFNSKENEVEWRSCALGLLLSYLPSPPSYLFAEASISGQAYVQPLALTCIRVLLGAYSTVEDLAELALVMPAHLRRDLMRWCAVEQPLDIARLRALCVNEGHVDGELIVVGPQASLRADFFAKRPDRGYTPTPPSTAQESDETVDALPADTWDAPSADYTPSSLTALALVTTPLPTNVLLSLPRTLTHLALLRLPQPTPVHNLPRVCPLLEVLDMSFNPWLGTEGTGTAPGSSDLNSLGRIEWARWRNLRVLGLRECGIGPGILRRVNEGRWYDVEVIGIDSKPSVSTSLVVRDDVNRPAP